MYAVVRVKGSVKIGKDIKYTLSMLRLNSVNHCVLVEKNPSMEGMLKATKNYITYGEVDEKTLKSLILKRGFSDGKRLDKKNAEEAIKQILKSGSVKEMRLNPVFRLSPPKKGYRSIRKPYPKGDSGYRGEKINELLERMI